MKLEFETPIVPNFVRVKGLNAPIAIWRLNEEELTEYAELWCETLAQKAKKRSGVRR